MSSEKRIPSKAAALISIGMLATAAFASDQATQTAQIDRYLQPYIRTKNFSGAVLISKNGRRFFEKAYGFADREKRLRNTTQTRFHIASVSMQFTAAAVLRLVDEKSLALDDRASGFAPGIVGGDKISIRDLLMQRSGLPDLNALPEYGDVLQHHQTPSTLIAKVEGKPLLFEPGTKFLHEEHSAYNLLALIIEKKTGKSFAAAVQELVFRPAGLRASGIDDDSIGEKVHMAGGYEPVGAEQLKPGNVIHWSAKTGNGAAYTTVGDAARWVDVLFGGDFLQPPTRDLVLETSARVGYGWFRGSNKRFGETAYYMNGRAPGFSSFVLYLPVSKLTVVVLSNIYSSATSTIGYDLAALVLNKPYQPFQTTSVTREELKGCTGTFQFGPDFYQSNATVTLVASDQQLTMHWPSGDVSTLLPVGRDRFVDRSYWTEVKVERDASGKPMALMYDQYRGTLQH